MSDNESVDTLWSAELEEELGRVIDAVNREDPDPEHLSRLRRALRKAPVVAEIVGDLSKDAREEIITGLKTSTFTKESVGAYVDHIANELGYESAPMLERLLIDQVVICWLRLYQIDMAYSQIRSGGWLTIDQGVYYERRLSAAQRRFLRACTTLARIRKMAGRTPELMQLNIGAQQVNVAQVSED